MIIYCGSFLTVPNISDEVLGLALRSSEQELDECSCNDFFWSQMNNFSLLSSASVIKVPLFMQEVSGSPSREKFGVMRRPTAATGSCPGPPSSSPPSSWPGKGSLSPSSWAGIWRHTSRRTAAERYGAELTTPPKGLCRCAAFLRRTDASCRSVPQGVVL